MLSPEAEDDERLLALMPEADILLVRRRNLPATLLEQASHLQAVVSVGERPRFSATAIEARGVPVILTPRYTAMAVADLVLGLMLAVSRNIITGHQGVLAGAYRDRGIEPQETSETQFAFNWLGLAADAPLHGRVLGLVGLGEIGALVARRAVAFGMSVLYFQRSPVAADQARALGVEYAPLDELLAASDILSLHVPETPATRHLIDRRALARMKPTAYLVNASRGRVVDEEALVEALRDQRLGGAALDVFGREPLPADSPLTGLKNVCLTPHLGGGTNATLVREMQIAFERIAALVREPAVAMSNSQL
jgi:phosphoglycerate dehydrogenase-like enzyme